MMKKHVIRITADNLANLPHWNWRSSALHFGIQYYAVVSSGCIQFSLVTMN